MPNDLATTEPEHQQNHQAMLHGVPKCDCDPPSIMISPSDGIVNDEHSEHLLDTENTLFSIHENDDISTNFQKPNRKIGVTTAVIEGMYVCICISIHA